MPSLPIKQRALKVDFVIIARLSGRNSMVHFQALFSLLGNQQKGQSKLGRTNKQRQ